MTCLSARRRPEDPTALSWLHAEAWFGLTLDKQRVRREAPQTDKHTHRGTGTIRKGGDKDMYKQRQGRQTRPHVRGGVQKEQDWDVAPSSGEKDMGHLMHSGLIHVRPLESTVC